MHAKTLHFIERFAVRAILALVSFIVLLPILWMLLFSLGDPGGGPGWSSFLPRGISLSGYRDVFRSTPFLIWVRNSLIIALGQTLLQIFIGFFAAYAFVRFTFPGRTLLFYFVLATMVIPAQALMIPTFVTINFFKMINTWAGVVVPFLASGYAIFLLRQFFQAVPSVLVDSARVDGCDEWGILRHIYLPVSFPSVAALAIILFVNHWNEYYWPLLVLSDKMAMTLPIAMILFRNEGYIEWMPTLAASTMATLPVIILYLITQRSFVEGFTASGIKG
jgi:multiple sugar transport system permease protein/sn-glycerol 3-phosphate transport system permease protein